MASWKFQKMSLCVYYIAYLIVRVNKLLHPKLIIQTIVFHARSYLQTPLALNKQSL